MRVKMAVIMIAATATLVNITIDATLVNIVSLHTVLEITLLAALLAAWVCLQQVKRSKSRIRSLVSAIADGVFMHDAEGRILEVNDRACESTGYSRDELLGMHIWDFEDGVDRDTLLQIWAELTEPTHVNGVHKRKDGSEFPVEVNVALGADGVFVATCRDISARLKAEEHLRESNDRLSEMATNLEEVAAAAGAANVAKGEFLANMSHEIRTPLTAILGFAEMLELDGDLGQAPPSRLNAVRTIRRNGDHLLRIISDILDLSKLDAGKLEIATEPCDLRAVVGDTVDSFRSLAKPGVELTTECPSVVVKTSPVRLRQILLNLVGNAVKFTESGSVRVTATLDRNQLTIDVDDTGPGMELGQADELFAPFHQLDNSATREHGGTGLGLAISHRLAVAMAGDVEIVRAAPGRGCTFRLSLPVTTSRAPAAAGEQRPLPPGLRVLVVEDRPDNRELLARMLYSLGVDRVDMAGDGEQGVMRVADGGEYDIILMDMHMPVMDGYTATRLLRESGHPGPIVAVTADMLNGTIERCLNAGCDGYLSKPVTAQSLSTTVAEFLSVIV